MKRLTSIILLLSISAALSGCMRNPLEPKTLPTLSSNMSTPTPANQNSASSQTKPMASEQPKFELINATQATISTSKGDIIIELFPDAAPNTIQIFLNKAKTGFYKNLTFHRVEDWVLQGGDPRGNGTGGGNQATELSQKPFVKGSVGIARGGDIKVSNDSQFFICKSDCGFLTGQYTIFGQVTKGMDVVEKMEIGDLIKDIKYQ